MGEENGSHTLSGRSTYFKIKLVLVMLIFQFCNSVKKFQGIVPIWDREIVMEWRGRNKMGFGTSSILNFRISG